ncbi:MAG: PDZ domain-containing protein [Chloroflexota bacterium]|nr:MAG: PDZ domain-containing protein [Chloroflexota bacterium]
MPPTPPDSPFPPAQPYVPPSEARPQWAQDALGPATPPTPSHWFEPDPTPAPAAAPPASRGRGLGGLVALLFSVALIAAVLASGGTYLALNASGLVGSTAQPSAAGATSAATTVSNQTVNIDEQSAITHAAQVVGPAVVTITGREVDPNQLFGSQQVTGIGSGVIFDKAGWILTNRHVVCGTNQLQVSLADGRTFSGTVYGTDTLTDLAIVKVAGSNLPVAPIGESSTLKQGQIAVAIGSPLGNFTNSVTAGIISASNRDIQVPDDCNQGQTVAVHNLLQTDAAINPGNSGGALVDSSAQVIGINTAVAGNAQGIGFAIPIDIAKPIMEQALAGDQLSRPYIGIRYQPVDVATAQANHLPIDYGAWITPAANGGGAPGVTADSPADKAGLKENDIITSIDGQRVDADHDLNNLLLRSKPGETVKLTVLRAGQTLTISVTLGTRPAGLQ